MAVKKVELRDSQNDLYFPKTTADNVYMDSSTTVEEAFNYLRNNHLKNTGGTLTGNLRLKNNSNYGLKINFGDRDYVHLHEFSDDKLRIKASKLYLKGKLYFENYGNAEPITEPLFDYNCQNFTL